MGLLKLLTFFSDYKLMPPSRCHYCGKRFPTPRAVNHHISASKKCSTERLNDLIRSDILSASPLPKRQKRESLDDLEGELGEDLADFEKDLGYGDDFVIPSPPREPSDEVRETAGGGGRIFTYPKDERFIESYPGEAGNGLRRSKTGYEIWLENQRGEEKIPWDLFANEQEWALAQWLLRNVGQKSADEFLKLPIVSFDTDVGNEKKKNSL